jgi:4-diphosphocytidyl-2-C-methyl-D-erythritol kinase
MIGFPNCKINIGLSVKEKRPDGFHNVETVMYPLALHDVLEIIISPRRKFTFTQTGLYVTGDFTNNLVYKAHELLKKDFNFPAVDIHLHKVIPAGAGLGGGSSDAAFTIRMINNLFNLRLQVTQMQEYAGKLGSDCAFFIKNIPVLAYGKGDQFKNIELNIDKYFIVLVKPDIHISTTEAYSWVKPTNKEKSLMEIVQAPVTKWKNLVINDFEKEVLSRYVTIKSIREEFNQMGAVYTSLTGSGSAVYGIFEKPVAIENRFGNHFIWTSFKT